jgi:hypothetical protein
MAKRKDRTGIDALIARLPRPYCVCGHPYSLHYAKPPHACRGVKGTRCGCKRYATAAPQIM